MQTDIGPDLRRSRPVLAVVLGSLCLAGTSCNSASEDDVPHTKESATAASNNEDEVVEVRIGDIHVRNTLPGESAALNISLTLYATVDPKDRKHLEQLLARKQQRMHESIVRVIRSCRQKDLGDPDLQVVRKQLLWQVNKTLGEPLAKTLLLSRLTAKWEVPGDESQKAS